MEYVRDCLNAFLLDMYVGYVYGIEKIILFINMIPMLSFQKAIQLYCSCHDNQETVKCTATS
jgi:hypothetical protein